MINIKERMTFRISIFRTLLGAFSVVIAAWLIVPTLVVIPISFTNQLSFRFPPPGWSLKFYKELLFSDTWRNAIIHTFTVGILVAVLATILGVLAAASIVRMRSWRANAAYGILLSPAIVPGIVVAIATYNAFLQVGLTGSYLGFIIAHTVLALPFPVVTVTAGLRSLDPALNRAAASLGASPIKRFFQVTVPMILPSIMSGALFAFMISFDEVVVGLFIQSPFFRTLPIQMFVSVSSETNPTIAAASTILITINSVVIAGFYLARNKAVKNVGGV